MDGLTVNPETLLIDGLERRTFTAAEFARTVPPDCPVCGAQVTIDRIDVTLNEEDHRQRGRSYIAGMWECPHHCDPRTGQRMHYSQSYESGVAQDGMTCVCSCGDEQVTVTADEFIAWKQVHHRPDTEVTVARRDDGSVSVTEQQRARTA
jgi:hypothetical protein